MAHFAAFAQYCGKLNQPSFEKVATDVLTRFPDGGHILEIGGSAGEPGLTIAKKFKGTIISTDVAPPNKELGAQRAAAMGLTNVEFDTVDACDLSRYGDGSFDAVVGGLVLMFVPDIDKACAEIFRVLKPGGVLITTCWQDLPKVDVFGKGIMVCMKGMMASGKLTLPPGAPPPPNPCKYAEAAPEGALADALKAAGFKNVTGEEHAYPIPLAAADRKDAARRFILGTPFAGMLKSAGGEELFDEAVDNLTKIFEDGGHEMDDLAKVCPEWTGVDNPDNLTTCMVFKHNASLYVTAEK